MIEDSHKDQDRIFVGVDEVGRGALAGPIAAAAYVLGYEDIQILSAQMRQGMIIRDSKKMTHPQRLATAAFLLAQVHIRSITYISPQEIDSYGITQANMKAMSVSIRSVLKDLHATDIQRTRITLIIDHHKLPGLEGYEVISIPHAESQSWAVAAASIWAKVARDALMGELNAEYPNYGWESNKGYGTAQHQTAIQTHGASPHHRRSFLGRLISSEESA